MGWKRLKSIVCLVSAVTLCVTALTPLPSLASSSFDSVTYQWIDLTDPGVIPPGNVTTLHSTDMKNVTTGETNADDGTASVNIGFEFPFYDKPWASAYVCTNGWLSENSTDATLKDHSIPWYGPALISPLMDDFTMGAYSSIIYGRLNSPNRFVVTWENFHHFTNPSNSPSTFQVVIYDTGQIYFNYKTVGTTSGVVVGVNEGGSPPQGYTYNLDPASASNTSLYTLTPDNIPPTAVDSSKISISQNPPGTQDVLSGSAGCGEKNTTLYVYSNTDLSQSNLIATTTLTSNGSFGVDVGDNKASSFYLVLKDVSGNPSPVVTLSNVNDITYPTLSVTSPQDGFATNSSKVTVTGNASDKSSLTVKVNGTAVSLSGGSFSTDVTLVPDSTNTITVTATDVAGNSTSATRTVIHDSLMPSLNISSSVPSMTRTSSIKISGTTEPDINLSVKRNGDATMSFSPSLDGSFTTPTILLSEGLNEITIVAERQGRAVMSKYSIVLDTRAPESLNVLLPRANTYLKNKLTFKIDCKDSGTGLDLLKVYVDRGIIAQFNSPSSGTYFTKTISITKNGKHVLSVKAKDKVGNQAASSSRTFFVDTYKPRILSLSLPRSAKLGSRVKIKFKVRESFSTKVKAWVRVLLGKKIVRTVSSKTYSKSATRLGYWNYLEWDCKNGRGKKVKVGKYKLIIYLSDQAGNREYRALASNIILRK